MNSDTSLDINNHSNPIQTVAQPKEDNEMLRATDKITALYCRLSVEDTKDEKKNGKEDLSNSIQNQKAMLLQYARDHRFPHPTFFIDDGYSGVTYDRPGFQKMLDEIEAGHVGVVITKDLSRLGRNSALTGLYINYCFTTTEHCRGLFSLTQTRGFPFPWALKGSSAIPLKGVQKSAGPADYLACRPGESPGYSSCLM